MPMDPPSGEPSGFECIARLGGDGLWTWRPGSQALVMNRGWFAMLGLEPITHCDLARLQSRLHPDDQARVARLFADLVAGRRDRVSTRIRLRHADGHDVWVRHRAYAVERDGDGRAMVIIGHDVDITAEVTAERRAAEEERRLRQTLDLVPTAVIVYGADGRLLRWNRAAAEQAGVEYERLPAYVEERRSVGWGIVDEAGDPMPDQDMPFWQALHTGRTPQPRVVGFETLRGRRWGLMSAVPSFDEHGAVVEVVCSITDITETRQLEAGLARARRLESLGRLAGAVAHDFNNLLTVITSTGELIGAELAPGSPACEDLAELQCAARRGAALTRQLLEYAHLRPSDTRALDPGRFVARTAATLRRLVPVDVDVRVSIAPDVWPVRCDPHQLDRVLLNLAVNAIDAMQPSGGALEISLRNEPGQPGDAGPGPSGDRVLLTVRDSGCGMPEAVRARAFDPFFTTKDIGAGTGLGLATCHGIVEEHGGHIRLDSEPGRGTTVEIRLPRCAERPRASTPPAATPLDTLGGEVLVVEDEAAVRETARRTLVRHGMRVYTARNGAEALERLDHGPPVQLVLTDVAMPGMDGRALAERIHRRWPELPVLFISGTRDPDLPTPRDGCFDYLPKPFGQRALVERVQAMLHCSKAPAVRPASPLPGPVGPERRQRRKPPSMSRQRPVK